VDIDFLEKFYVYHTVHTPTINTLINKST